MAKTSFENTEIEREEQKRKTQGSKAVKMIYLFKIPKALKHSQNLILNLDFISDQTTQLLDSNGHHKESFQLIPRLMDSVVYCPES